MDTSTITAGEIMTRHLVTTTARTHVLDAVDQLVARRISGLPVVSSDRRFVGQFSERSAIACLDLADMSGDPASLDARSCLRLLIAADVMKPPALVLQSDSDVFSCANLLLRKKVSGAPVVSKDGSLLGVFSEKSAMQVFIGLCWEQLPSAHVAAWADRADDRRISESTSLPDILDRFQQSSFRRLMVVRDGRFIGEVTRRTALAAAVECSRTPLAASRTKQGRDGLGLRATVGFWMLREVPVLSEAVDVMTAAQLFIHSLARQLPVLEGRKLQGQISRSDLLRAVQRYFPVPQVAGSGPQPLYLSSVHASRELALMQ